jgi:hypothetical protein
MKLSNWRDYMTPIRQIAFQLARDDRIHILQKMAVIPVDALDAVKGPIRLRLVPADSELKKEKM